MRRAAVHPHHALRPAPLWRLRGDVEAELGSHHDFIAAPFERLQRPANELLIGEWPVNLCRVPEIHTEIERTVQGGNGLRVVGITIRKTHAHASQPDCRHLQTL
ncbi:hypothetical protein D3C72_1535900 [compost metagenome]